MITKTQLKQEIAALGIAPNDTVLIHTSFKSIGDIEGGADTLIDAFTEYLRDGLFLVPTHTWANVNRDQPVYRAAETVPCIGLVPRTAACRKDGIRSLHPTHSVWACGKEAAAFVAGEEAAETPCPVGGAWWRLGEVHAKLLLIGVGLSSNTYIHAIDEIAGLDDRLARDPWNVTVVAENGQRFTHPFRNHGRTGSANFDNFERPLTARGAMTVGKLGNATVRMVDAAKCRDVLLDIYSRTSENLCLTRQEIPEALWHK
ncbi:MAG: AAC(3) family N-acetyltransferase [Clostridia bacterium]|nr:AAC(3) family N-acetyltransferase [Clostridia bacterium]